ncbi:hypothetical protein CONPUDRAFT_165495 [Coniophora puteana RWD-64-598 SS2]|uniref:Concanavalin A-like lectin glucanase n=1 Tax=Coniophora puteana (strain RWD-64-598) TaxID=741705 RepID=A0A5M3MRZ3_CONPW|nr:uncharacterized protein CONPUDRAFT_165495 [Coniophora puteana RWD-64-598 SS2]EIW81321.1 hypothetical protein CONPUDRAFT_165495 [Coniophora puteana RWD-64-598 SS2]
MYAFAILANLLLASVAIAIPTSAERRAARHARRVRNHLSHPAVPQSSQSSKFDVAAVNVTQETFTTNWAGAVWSEGQGTFTSVTGTFTVPTASGSGSSSASAWVGIDGASCGNAILQTGVDFNADGTYDGESFRVNLTCQTSGAYPVFLSLAWYEWYPAGAVDFQNFPINSGDVITVTVTATSTTSGTAVIENTTQNQQVTQDLTSSSALCEQDAEWIVEDFEENGGLVPFADFGTVTFSQASATSSSGSVSPSGATVYDIQQNGQQLTQTTIDGSDVTIQYQ